MHKKAMIIKRRAEENGFKYTIKALKFAYKKHKDQYRDDGTEYILHPLRVCLSLIANGILDDEIWTVALLHDVLEDTDTTRDELEKVFNKDIAYMVDLLTKKDGISLEKYIMNMAIDVRVALIKAADRVDNISDMINGFTIQRMKRYIEETEKIILELMKKTRKKYYWCADNFIAFSSHIKAVLLYAKKVVELEEELLKYKSEIIKIKEEVSD